MEEIAAINSRKRSERTVFRRMPAEWERQSMVQLTWPHLMTDWVDYLKDITDTMTEIAIAIAEREPLLIVTQTLDATEAWLRRQMTMKQWLNTRLVKCLTNDTWARDHAFLTVFDYPQLSSNDTFRDFSQRQSQGITELPHFKTLLDFQFNGWGKKFSYNLDDKINRHIYAAKAVEGRYESHADFVLEGGAIESDGNGVIFTTRNCMMAANRNQPLKISEIEEELKRRLGAEKIVWFRHGKLKGDDTDGHIDTMVRIAPKNTLVYVEQNDENDQHFREFDILKTEVRKLRTNDGGTYKRVALPFPEPIYDERNRRLPATYANYLVINGAVLVPIYNQPKYDRQACLTLASVYPDRTIIPIDARTIIRQHGSIHCLAMQYY